MKKHTSLALGLAALLMMSGCSSSQQANGTFPGASLGGIFGSAIGGLIGGPRGSDAGTVVGMVVGGAAGAAITAPKADNQPTYGYGDETRQPQRGDEADSYAPSQIEGLSIENIRFIDDSRDQTLQAGEQAKIIFNIYNRGSQTLYNVTPIVTADNKHVSISPSAIVSDLRPGRGVTYTAAVLAGKRLRQGEATFTIAFQDGRRLATFKTFTIATQR